MPELRSRNLRADLLAALGAERETQLARTALGVAAMAVIDKAFLRPEPGTVAGDHLASGLVPLVAAIALAYVFPRMRAGARGAVAVVSGVLAITGGVADSSLLSLVAGAVLLPLGSRILWRSRRLDERPLRRYGRRALVGVAVLVAGFLIVFPMAFAIVATHRSREPVARVDLGRPYQSVRFETADGLRLAGWYVPSRNRAAVIVAPGRSGTTGHARMLARAGYGVLVFDRRGEGESEGDFNAFGWGGDADLKGALTFLAARDDVDPARIGGLGLSVGGEMLLETAAEDGRLGAVVSEGAGVRSLAEHWSMPGLSAAQKPFSNWVVQTAALAVLSDSLPPAGLPKLVRRIAPRPVLLIRGLAGQEQEVLNRVLFRQAGEPKTLWEVPRAGHTAALTDAPVEYRRRVVGFFDRALRGRRAEIADRPR